MIRQLCTYGSMTCNGSGLRSGGARL